MGLFPFNGGCFVTEAGNQGIDSLAGLGEIVAVETMRRSGVQAVKVGHAVFGRIINTCPADAYLARNIDLATGMPDSSAAFNVNRLCGSALQSLGSAAQLVMNGDSQLALLRPVCKKVALLRRVMSPRLMMALGPISAVRQALE
ncbi:MAG: hypothetical protein OIF57_05320 [Marinobacterium sp.]|nr:hypothetical protein [Marinobacterium sp.]